LPPPRIGGTTNWPSRHEGVEANRHYAITTIIRVENHLTHLAHAPEIRIYAAISRQVLDVWNPSSCHCSLRPFRHVAFLNWVASKEEARAILMWDQRQAGTNGIGAWLIPIRKPWSGVVALWGLWVLSTQSWNTLNGRLVSDENECHVWMSVDRVERWGSLFPYVWSCCPESLIRESADV